MSRTFQVGHLDPAAGGGCDAERADATGLRARDTADGHVDTQVRTASGAWVRVHSLYAPEAEASGLLDRALNGNPVPPVVAVLGVGLGYVIDELERRRPDVRIVALELVPEFVERLSIRRDWSEAIRRGHLVRGVDPQYELSAPAWPPAATGEAPLIIVHPVLGQHCPAALDRARKAFKQFIFEQRANTEARRRLSGLYLRHTIENLPALVTATDASALDGIAAGAPVVLCGAGPSLDGLLPSLLAHRDRAWFVALDTGLRPLMQAGIVPDIVVSVDPTPLNGRHLINLPTRARPWLVAEMSLDPRAISAFAGRIVACRIGRADPWPWLERLDLSPSRLRVWGSVLTAACDLISRMQASRVVFAGIDLAFTNGQPYCRGTAFEEDWLAQQQRDGLSSIEAVWRARIDDSAAKEPDIYGRSARTSPPMIAFRNWVRTVVASAPEREFINASGAGILHGPGIAQADIADVFGGQEICAGGEAALRAATRRSFSEAVPRLRSAIETVTSGQTGSLRDVWQMWAEAVPQFDAERTRRLLRQAGQRLRAQEGTSVMTTNETDTSQTDWIDVPYDPELFFAKAPLEWSVGESSVVTYAYRVHGKTMTLVFKIENSTLEVDSSSNQIPSNEIHLRIPDHYLPARGTANAIWMGSVAGRECGYATVHPGLDVVVVFRGSEDQFPLDPGCFCLFGQLTFEVQ